MVKSYHRKRKRKSHIEIGEVYFWTATLNGWKNLLANDAYKDIIINPWQAFHPFAGRSLYR